MQISCANGRLEIVADSEEAARPGFFWGREVSVPVDTRQAIGGAPFYVVALLLGVREGGETQRRSLRTNGPGGRPPRRSSRKENISDGKFADI